MAGRTSTLSPAVVWAVLTDSDAYEDWNPWITWASGTAEVGGAVDVWSGLGEKRMSSTR